MDKSKVKTINNNKFYYKNNELHRLNGPAIEYDDGEQHWYQNGKLHRLDGPAVIDRHLKVWWVNGKKHRTNGPAIETNSESKASYFLDGRKYTKNQYDRLMTLGEDFWNDVVLNNNSE